MSNKFERLSAKFGAAGTTSVDDARREFWHLFRSYETVPAHALQSVAKTIDGICEAAQGLSITTIADLCLSATRVMSAVTGITDPTQFQKAGEGEALHVARNLMLAMAAAAFVVIGADPQPAYSEFPRLAQRTRIPRRPLFDDEIVLCRVHAAHLMNSGAISRRNATTYAAADAGIPPTEATAIQAEHVAFDAEAPGIWVPQNRSYNARTIPISEFHVRAFAEPVSTSRSPKQFVTYMSRKNAPGSDAAAASVHGVLKKILVAVGIKGDDLTASSIYLWRLGHVLDSDGVAVAADLAGFGQERAELLLNLFDRRRPTKVTAPPPVRGRGFAA